jgi:hypothetical protein
MHFSRMQDESVTDFVTDGIPFSPEDLMPQPFLWDDVPKLEPRLR